MRELTWEDVPGEVIRLIKAGSATTSHFKLADVMLSDILSPIGQATGATSGKLNELWGGPRPLSDMIAGGALGAGAGYGAGWLAEKLLPSALAGRRLRKTLAMVGGTMGALPGAAQAIDNWSQDRGILDPWPTQKAGLLAEAQNSLAAQFPGYVKAAQEPSAIATDFEPFIDRDGLNNLILRTGNLAPAIAAATTGLVNGAAQLRGDDAQYISPFDIGRIAMGMGSGLLSGIIVGRTLGALTGMPRSTQDQLARAGVVAGLLTNVVPMALSAR